MNQILKKTQQVIAKCSGSLQAISVALIATKPVQQSPQVIGITSQYAGEGCSTLALGMAQSLSKQQKGKVLLIDAVVGAQDLTQLLSLQRMVLKVGERFEWPSLLQTSAFYGIDVLSLSAPSLEWLATDTESHPAWQRLLAEYRWVIVDVGAWSTPTPHLWAQRLEQAVLVVDVNATTADKLSRFRAEIDRSQLKMLGFILNKRTYPIPEKLYRLAS
jgi:Mrp family chromosome partitioning ATPase